jgi:hypothetical protein
VRYTPSSYIKQIHFVFKGLMLFTILISLTVQFCPCGSVTVSLFCFVSLCYCYLFHVRLLCDRTLNLGNVYVSMHVRISIVTFTRARLKLGKPTGSTDRKWPCVRLWECMCTTELHDCVVPGSVFWTAQVWFEFPHAFISGYKSTNRICLQLPQHTCIELCYNYQTSV